MTTTDVIERRSLKREDNSILTTIWDSLTEHVSERWINAALKVESDGRLGDRSIQIRVNRLGRRPGLVLEKLDQNMLITQRLEEDLKAVVVFAV